MSKMTARQYAQALYMAISDTATSDYDKVLDNFVQVLKENRDMEMIDEIENEFITYEQEAKGIKTARVSSAHELTRAEEKKIVEQLNKLTNEKIKLEKKVDENLIGGFVVKLGDKVIDGSVRKQLKQLKDKLIN